MSTKHYPMLRSYVREVAKDLIERGRIRRASGQSIDMLIKREIETVIAEVAGDIRTLGVELGVSTALSSVRLFELLVRQATDDVVSTGVEAIFNMIANSAGVKPRR